MTDLTSQTVLVVGASSGIGLATVKAAAARGASVIMLSRSPEKLAAATAGLVGGGVHTLAANVLDREAVHREIGSLGPIDHLVLTAVADELASAGRVDQLSPPQVERSFDKLRGFVNVLGAACGKMSSRGSISLLSGASALKPTDGASILAAAAGSIVSFGRALAIELAPLRVNVVMPGVVDTPIHEHQRDQVRAWAESTLPARRFGQPEDIAAAILFLMTNPYMTGHTLVIDGGLVLT